MQFFNEPICADMLKKLHDDDVVIWKFGCFVTIWSIMLLFVAAVVGCVDECFSTFQGSLVSAMCVYAKSGRKLCLYEKKNHQPPLLHFTNLTCYSVSHLRTGTHKHD